MAVSALQLKAEIGLDESALDRGLAEAERKLREFAARKPTAVPAAGPGGDTTAQSEKSTLAYAQALARLQVAQGNAAAGEQTLRTAVEGTTRGTLENIRATTQLERVQQQAAGSTTTLRGAIGGIQSALGAAGIVLGAQQVIQFGASAIEASNNLERTQATVQALSGSQERYNQVLELARAGQQKYGGSLSDNLAGLGSLVNLSNRAGVELSNLDNVARRLAVVDPLQGISGATVALKEFLTGSDATAIQSLVRRFELPKSALKDLTNESLTTQEKLAGLDKVLADQGITQEVLSNQTRTTAASYVQLGAAFDNAKTSAGGFLAEGLAPAATGLTRLTNAMLGSRKELAELQAAWDAFLKGRTVTGNGIAGITAQDVARSRVGGGIDQGGEIAVRLATAGDAGNEAALTKARDAIASLRAEAERLTATDEKTAASVDLVVKQFAETGDIDAARQRLVLVEQAYKGITAAANSSAPAYLAAAQSGQQAAIAAAEHAKQTALDAKEIERLQNQLENIADRGAAASDRLSEAQVSAGEAAQRAREDQARRIGDIQEGANKRLESLDRDYQRAGVKAEADFNEAVAKTRTDGHARIRDLEDKAGRDQEDARADLVRKLQGLEEDAALSRTDAERGFTDRVADVRASGYAKLQALDADAQRLAEAAAEQHADRLTAITQRSIDLQTQADNAAADRARDANDRIYDARTRAQDSAEDRAQTHADKLEELQGKLNEAIKDKDKEKAQKDIDQENEEFARKDARAQRDLAREEERLNRERQQAEQDAAERLAQQQADLERQRVAEEAAYAKQEAARQAKLERDRAAATAEAQAKLADIQKNFDAEEQQRNAKLARDVAAAQTAYALQEQERAASLARERQSIADDAQTRLTELQAQYEREKAEKLAQFVEARTDAQTARDEQLADAQEGFARQEAQRRESADRQYQQLRESLGKELIAYTEQQGLLQKLTAQQVEQRRAAIVQAYGVDPKESASQFAGLAATFGAGQTTAAGTTVNGVTIVIPDARTPRETALAVRDELLAIGRENGTIFGGRQ